QGGRERYPKVSWRRGITGDLTVWTELRKPLRDAEDGPEFADTINQASPSLTIELQDEKHATVQTWTLQNVWISKLSGPSLNAKGNEIALESVEVVCERIDLS